MKVYFKGLIYRNLATSTIPTNSSNSVRNTPQKPIQIVRNIVPCQNFYFLYKPTLLQFWSTSMYMRGKHVQNCCKKKAKNFIQS